MCTSPCLLLRILSQSIRSGGYVFPVSISPSLNMSKREDVDQFWSQSAGDLIKQLGASPAGLTSAEAKRRLEFYGPNRLHSAKRTDSLTLLLAQFKSPLILILLGAVVLFFFLGQPVDAIIIIAIVLLSSVLGFWQEKRATDAVKSLLAIWPNNCRPSTVQRIDLGFVAEIAGSGSRCRICGVPIHPGDCQTGYSDQMAKSMARSYPELQRQSAATMTPMAPRCALASQTYCWWDCPQS